MPLDFVWKKIDSCDWKCVMPNGDMLRVERMDRNYVWWAFYTQGNCFHCYDFYGIRCTNIAQAKKEVEKYYTEKSNSDGKTRDN